jgi:hypothetical protein
MYFFPLVMHHLKRELGQWSAGLTCQLQKGSGTRLHIPGLLTLGGGGGDLYKMFYPCYANCSVHFMLKFQQLTAIPSQFFLCEVLTMYNNIRGIQDYFC